MKELTRPDLFPECATCAVANMAYMRAADNKYLYVVSVNNQRVEADVKINIKCYFVRRYLFLRQLTMKVDAVSDFGRGKSHQGWFEDVTDTCPGIKAKKKA